MRVLSVGNMYPPHHQGGYELIWQDADRHLGAAGHEVRVLTTDHSEPGVREAGDADVRRELRWYWRDHGWPRLGATERLALERHNARVFDAHLAGFAPDAVAWWSMGGMSLSLMERARRAGVPGVGLICDEWLVYGPEVDQWIRLFRRRPWLRGIGALTGLPTRVDLPACARYLYLSDVLRNDAANADPGLGAGEVAHRGPDTRDFREAPARPWAWRLAYVGRIDPRKGIDDAIRALAELPAEARLAVVGGGDTGHLDELRRLAAQLGLEDRVAFSAASRAELQAAYAEADAVVFPVRWREPWGLVPLEAMAVGRPVVATGAGGSGEYLEDGGNCLLYDPGQGAGALAARLRDLAGDEGLRARLRAGGLETAAGISARRYNELIEAALAAAGEPAN